MQHPIVAVHRMNRSDTDNWRLMLPAGAAAIDRGHAIMAGR
jgi:hypothetical protein